MVSQTYLPENADLLGRPPRGTGYGKNYINQLSGNAQIQRQEKKEIDSYLTGFRGGEAP